MNDELKFELFKQACKEVLPCKRFHIYESYESSFFKKVFCVIYPEIKNNDIVEWNIELDSEMFGYHISEYEIELKKLINA